MKRVLASIIVAGMAVTAMSSTSFAGANANAKIQLHLAGLTTKAQCTRTVARPACAGIVTHGDLYPAVYFAYVLITDGDATAGLAGLQFGIQYGSTKNDAVGVDIFGWTLCATLEFQQPTPVWPENGGGNLITWDMTNVCQRFEPGGAGTGVVADAGYFYLGAYSAADMYITERPVDGMSKVADCSAAEDNIEGSGNGTNTQNEPVYHNPSHLGSLGFGAGHNGYSPCGLNTPVENTTWSAVKSLYNGR